MKNLPPDINFGTLEYVDVSVSPFSKWTINAQVNPKVTAKTVKHLTPFEIP